LEDVGVTVQFSQLVSAMKSILIVGLLVVGLATLFVRPSALDTVASCTTMDRALLNAPNGGAVARYENRVCKELPEILESRVLVQREGEKEWHLVFRATSPVDPAFDPKTKTMKLKMRWIDAGTLSVDPAPDLVTDMSIGNEYFKVLISTSGGALLAPPRTHPQAARNIMH
jgi:hypothetical protein